ncbi:hypothetical protein [Aureibacter tunicatorum]|uniref:Membrane-associated HD superfamily phosphohydrolase n=1 Tax=Aureibacter tunicatorum TaxID=866807 RepID=A0AAE3XMW4_9BACT|nr:hypothetical protein [Aureibacter tunicatorum]MDR6239882.1 membrane-associated HD superfamily phosphohydrolase [Aureibacter tunicatorum]BDD04357.1 hypothetical protein AUTU_18400 [Aureibacter tunicatorum]
MNLIIEGGVIFTGPITLIMISIVVLCVYAMMKKESLVKVSRLIHQLSLFVLAFGFFGQMLGLYEAFKTISAVGSVSPQIMFAGLRVSSISPMMGVFTYLLARIAVMILENQRKGVESVK